MKRSLFVLGIGFAIALSWQLGRMQGQAQNDGALYVSPEHATFSSMPGGTGVSTAPIWGNANTGAHATFTKFAPGYDAGMHTHTNDVWIVGIKGAYLYKDEKGEKRIGPGVFLRVPGGHKHWSGGDKKEGALFYEESSGKFDLIPAH